MMLPIPNVGTLVAVHGQDDARRVPASSVLELTIVPGREVRPLPEGDRYLGFLFARRDTPQVEAALRPHAKLTIEIRGEISGEIGGER